MSPLSQLNAQLLKSIISADKEVLQATLIFMCESSHECLLQASSRLLVSTGVVNHDEDDEEEEEEEQDEDEVNASPPKSKKRKMDDSKFKLPLKARYRKCQICDEMFDVTTNNDEACKTHDGEKEIDVECFPEDDEIEYGPGPSSIDVDTDWRVESCPEGFPWSCCDEPADHEGCIVQRHKA